MTEERHTAALLTSQLRCPSHRGRLNGVCGTSAMAGSPVATITGNADMVERAKKDSIGEEDWPHCRKIKTVGLAITH